MPDNAGLSCALYPHLNGACVLCSAVKMCEDEQGVTGIRIGQEVTSVASRALNLNIRSLAPRILPLSEQLIYAGNRIARKVCPGIFERSTVDCLASTAVAAASGTHAQSGRSCGPHDQRLSISLT